MNLRSSRSMVTFSNAFGVSGCLGKRPAGECEILVAKELLKGLSLDAGRRTSTFLTFPDSGSHESRTELRPITESDLEPAFGRDRAVTLTTNHSEAALSPLEDLE